MKSWNKPFYGFSLQQHEKITFIVNLFDFVGWAQIFYLNFRLKILHFAVNCTGNRIEPFWYYFWLAQQSVVYSSAVDCSDFNVFSRNLVALLHAWIKKKRNESDVNSCEEPLFSCHKMCFVYFILIFKHTKEFTKINEMQSKKK